MKLLVVIVQDQDSQVVGDELRKANVRATRLASTGGFLRAGNTTFLVGIDDERVDEVLTIIQENCQSREQYSVPAVHLDSSIDTVGMGAMPIPVQVGGATVFVLPVDAFYRF